ncbi:hypothetical protein Tco_0094017, partial [Tanacetum coccineum]
QTVLTSTAMKVNTAKHIVSNQKFNTAKDYPHRALKNKGIIDSGCSRHMTGNKAYLAEFQDFDGGPVAFGGGKGYITGKGKIKTGKLDFEDVCFVKELQPSAGYNWRPQRYHGGSKYNGGSSLRNCYTFKDPLGRLKPKQAWVPKRI